MIRRLLAAFRSRAFRAFFLLVVLAAVAVAVARDADGLLTALARIGPTAVVLAGLANVGNVLGAGMAFRAALSGLGTKMPTGRALRVFTIGQLAKYLPGSVWSVLAQAELAADDGVPRKRTAVASAVGLGLALAVGAVLAVPAVFLLPGLPAAPLVLLAVAPVLFVLAHPRVLGAALAFAGRLSRGRLPAERLQAPALIRAQAWTVLSWLLLSLHMGILAVSAGAPVDGSTLLVAVSGYPLAWLAGFLVVFAPAGAGAREVVLIAVLITVLDPTSALAVALVSRVLTILGDVLPAAGCLAAGRILRSPSSALPLRDDGGEAERRGIVSEARRDA